MRVEDLMDEIGTSDSHLAHLQQADNPDYEVVTVLNFEQDENEERIQITDARWDHQTKQLLLIQP